MSLMRRHTDPTLGCDTGALTPRDESEHFQAVERVLRRDENAEALEALTALRAASETRDGRISRADKARRCLAAQLEALKCERDELDRDLQQAREDLLAGGQERSALRRRISALEREVLEQKEQAACQDQLRQELESSQADLRKTIAELKERDLQWRHRCSELERAANSAEEGVEVLRLELEQLQDGGPVGAAAAFGGGLTPAPEMVDTPRTTVDLGETPTSEELIEVDVSKWNGAEVTHSSFSFDVPSASSSSSKSSRRAQEQMLQLRVQLRHARSVRDALVVAGAGPTGAVGQLRVLLSHVQELERLLDSRIGLSDEADALSELSTCIESDSSRHSISTTSTFLLMEDFPERSPFERRDLEGFLGASSTTAMLEPSPKRLSSVAVKAKPSAGRFVSRCHFE